MRQTHKMVKYTHLIRRQQPINCLSVCDYFVGLAVKGIMFTNVFHICPLALVWSAVNLMKLSWMNVVPATSQNCKRLPPK